MYKYSLPFNKLDFFCGEKSCLQIVDFCSDAGSMCRLLMKITSHRLGKNNVLAVYYSFQYELTVAFTATFSHVEGHSVQGTKKETKNLLGMT